MKSQVKQRLYGLAGVVLTLLAWELLSRSAWLPPGVLPALGDCAAALSVVLAEPAFWKGAVWQTVALWAAGLALVTAVGLPVGLALGLSSSAYAVCRSSIDFFRSIPNVALLPLLVMVFGTQGEMVLTMVLLGAVWPVLIHAVAGVRAIDPVVFETARVFHIGVLRRFFLIVLPGALPFIATGFRVSAALTLIIVVVTGLVSGAPGLGKELTLAQNATNTPLVFGLVLFVGVLGLCLNALVGMLEKPLLRWHLQPTA